MYGKDGYMYQNDGKPWLTDADKKVPNKCPKCGLPITIKLIGEPIFICDNKHYFGTLKFTGSLMVDR